MSSSTSSGTISVLVQVDWYLGCTGGGRKLSTSAWLFSFAGVAPLLLSLEKSGIVVVRGVAPTRFHVRDYVFRAW